MKTKLHCTSYGQSPVFVKEIAFQSSPSLGSVYMKEGQRYECVGVEGYQREDGQQSALLCWKTHCPECGAAFIAKTPLRHKGISRRCPKHRAPGRKVVSVKKNG